MRLPKLFLFCILLAVLTGCGTQTINPRHGAVPQPTIKRSGLIYVIPFEDSRTNAHELIGVIRNGYHMQMGQFTLPKGENPTRFMERVVSEVLSQAGYEPRAGTKNQFPRLEGDILDLWVDGSWNIEAKVRVRLKLTPTSERQPFEVSLAGSEANPPMSLHQWGPHLKSYGEALDLFMQQAIKIFESEEFFRIVNELESRPK
jgi:hypothetical protein